MSCFSAAPAAAYSTSTDDVTSDRYGWAALDRYVLGALAVKPDCTARQVAPHIPSRLVGLSLRILEQQGLVARRKVRAPVDPAALLVRLAERTVWEPTELGVALLGGARKAA